MPPSTTVGRTTGSVRDVQRQKVYDAQGVVCSHQSAVAKRLLAKTVKSTGSVSIAACQEYVDHLTTSAPFQRRYGRMQIPVTHKVYGDATWDGGDISLPPWSRTEYVILHEVAHAVVARCFPRDVRRGPLGASHGPLFAAVYLDLVQMRCGAAAAKALREAYSTNRVKYRPAVSLLPRPDRPVVTRDALAAKRKAREARPVSRHEAGEVAALLRRAVTAGQFGPSGRKPREHALATARLLEKIQTPVAASRP